MLDELEKILKEHFIITDGESTTKEIGPIHLYPLEENAKGPFEDYVYDFNFEKKGSKYKNPLIVDNKGYPIEFDKDMDIDILINLLKETPEKYTDSDNIYSGKDDLPITKGMPDIVEMHNRYNIPLLFKFMRGLIENENVKVYVNFNEYKRQNEYKNNIFKNLCRDVDCQYIWMPIKDFSLPTIEQMKYWLYLCFYCRKRGIKMVYHCGSGKGRTAYMTLCNKLYLIKNNKGNPQLLIDHTKKLFPIDWDTMISKGDDAASWFYKNITNEQRIKLILDLRKSILSKFIDNKSVNEIFDVSISEDGLLLFIKRILMIEKILKLPFSVILSEHNKGYLKYKNKSKREKSKKKKSKRIKSKKKKTKKNRSKKNRSKNIVQVPQK